MIYLHIFNADGALKIRQQLGPEDDAQAIAEMNGSSFFVLDETGYWPDQVYFEDGAIIQKPAKPSIFHQFDYATKQWIDPRTPDDLWAAVRVQRNALLSASDWTQLPDVPGATQSAWTSYRQALRDITNQPDPSNVTWPTEPI